MFLWKLFYIFLALKPTITLGLTLKNPKPQRIFSQKEDGEAKIKFNWEMNSGGNYFLEFSLDDQFESVLESRKISSLPYIWKTDITGHVWWRVSLFDENKNLLERSKKRRLTNIPFTNTFTLSPTWWIYLFYEVICNRM